MKLEVAVNCVLIFLAIFFINKGNAKLAPDFIVPCNDTSRTCLLKATQNAIPLFTKGIPALGVTALDPFSIEKLSIPLAGLDWNLYKAKISGLRKCIVDDIAMVLEKNKCTLTLHCNVTVKGLYDAKGHFLLFTIDGEGEAKIKITNLKINLDINTKLIKAKDNLEYYAIKNYKYTISYGGNVLFKIENLFKQSKELSDTVLQFINANWRDVVEEFGKPIADNIVERVLRTVEHFFLKVPFVELINAEIPQ